jgi:hypothetical protein
VTGWLAGDASGRRLSSAGGQLARGNLAGLGTRAWARLTEHGTVGTGSLGRGRVSLACTTPLHGNAREQIPCNFSDGTLTSTSPKLESTK